MKSWLARPFAVLALSVFLSSAAMAAETVSLEPGMDRLGGDYKGFALEQAEPEQCRGACTSDAMCKAFTYVKPGVKGPTAMCYLKSTAVAASANDCCVSGAKLIKLNPGVILNLKLTPDVPVPAPAPVPAPSTIPPAASTPQAEMAEHGDKLRMASATAKTGTDAAAATEAAESYSAWEKAYCKAYEDSQVCPGHYEGTTWIQNP